MIELNRWHRCWLLLSLAFSFCVAFNAPRQDEDEEPEPGCIEASDFKEMSRAILSNRAQQLENLFDLDDKQASRLRVMLKRVLMDAVYSHQEMIDGPTTSKVWKKYLEKALSDSQWETLREYDIQILERRSAAEKQFELEPNDENRLELAASNLKSNLFLNDTQDEQVSELLQSFLSSEQAQSNESTWESFYNANRDQLSEILSKDQLYFFLDSESRRMSERLTSSTAWQQSNCTDCHLFDNAGRP